MHISYISMLALKFNIPKPPECWVLYRFVPKAPAPASPTSKPRAYPSPGKAVWVDEFPRIPFGGRCENSLEFTIDGSEIPPFTSWYGKYPIIDRVLAPSQEVQQFFHQQYGEWSVSPKHSGLYKDTTTTNRSRRFHRYCLTAQGARYANHSLVSAACKNAVSEMP